MEEPSAWQRLAGAYERGRQQPDSLDALLEWPAQRHLIGDVTGLRILDVGCGSGAKAVQLAAEGAAAVVGIDVAEAFVTPPPHLDVRLVTGDLSHLSRAVAHALPADGDSVRFDRILFLQSLGYSADVVATLRAARDLLTVAGRIVVARAHPIRYAVERSERTGLGLGSAYHCGEPISYSASWDQSVQLRHRTDTFAGMLNQFSAAGLVVEHTVEPWLEEDSQRAFPRKQEWMDRYLGTVVFRLRAADGNR